MTACKDDHLKLFDSRGFSWPPARTAFFDGSLDQLEVRAFECAVFAHLAFPADMNNPKLVEWMDVNESLTRSTGAVGLQNPWKKTVPTLTCQIVLIFRRIVANKLVYRQLDGVEMLQMIGFDHRYIDLGNGGLPTHISATKLSGNAFSAFAVGPVLMSVFANIKRERTAINAESADGDASGIEIDSTDSD